MELNTLATIGILVALLLGFLVNYLHEPDFRQGSVNMVFFAFAILLIFSSFKMLYTGEMGAFNFKEGEVKILMKTHPLEFWGNLIFKLSFAAFIVYMLFLKITKK